MTLFEKRLAAAEAQVGVADLPMRLCFIAADTLDPAAEIARHEAEAERDGVRPMIVRFVRSGDVVSAGRLH